MSDFSLYSGAITQALNEPAEHAPDGEQETQNAAAVVETLPPPAELNNEGEAPAPVKPDDIVITIAYAGSSSASKWYNKSLTFRQFKDELRKVHRTAETVSEYAAFSDARKKAAKDVGGFVGGASADGKRKKSSIITRTLFTADLDHATKSFADDPRAVIDFAAVLYPTHGSTEDAPRLRIVAPLSRECTAAEYNALALHVAQQIGVNMYDDCSFIPNQLMFWPSCPLDAKFELIEIDGEALNVDEILKARAASVTETGKKALTEKQQATAARNIEVIHTTGNKPQDPRTKKGIIGAVCRAYTISTGIERFLSDCYEPAGDDLNTGQRRYTWKRGGGFAGLVVYDDLLAYSYHGTDAANDGHEKNIFDLIAVHLYNGDAAAAKTALREDPAVKIQAIKDKQAETARDFKVEATDESPAGWTAGLSIDQFGHIEPTLNNCKLILENDSRFRGFALNVLAGAVEVTGKETQGARDQRGKVKRALPWTRENGFKFWKDTDRAHLITTLHALYAPFSEHTVDTAFLDVADTRRFNPLRDWLDGLPEWDKIPRVNTLLSRCLGAAQTIYTAAVLRKTLLAAVARVYIPALKFDYVAVLDGPQGIGKSTFWRTLAGEDYFTDSLTLEDMNDKTGAEKIQGFWFAELAELAGMNTADTRKMRSFITRKNDDFRAAYAHNSERRPRVCILVGTVNGDRGYLNDPEGQRRFWPVKCQTLAGVNSESGRRVWNISENDRAQIWAEILDAFNPLFVEHIAGNKKPLENALQMDTPELQAAEFEAQSAALAIDDRESRVERFLDYPIPAASEWDALSIEDRVHFLSGETWALAGKITSDRRIRNRTCGLEIWTECFKGDMQRYGVREQRMIAQIMKRLSRKWINTHKTGDFGPYGARAIEYVRNEDIPAARVWIEPEKTEFKPETRDERDYAPF